MAVSMFLCCCTCNFTLIAQRIWVVVPGWLWMCLSALVLARFAIQWLPSASDHLWLVFACCWFCLLLVLRFGIQWLLIAVKLRCEGAVWFAFEMSKQFLEFVYLWSTRDVKRKGSQEKNISETERKTTDKTRMPRERDGHQEKQLPREKGVTKKRYPDKAIPWQRDVEGRSCKEKEMSRERGFL